MKHIGTRKIVLDDILLRQFAEEDVEELYMNYGRDPEVSRFVSFAPCITSEGTRSFVEMHLEKYDEDPDFYGWAIDYEGQVIGCCGLFDVNEINESVEMGISMGSAWHGKGFGTRIMAALIDYGFSEIGLHRIYANHHVDNVASGNIMVRNNMVQEGRLRDGQRNMDGTYSDLIQYSILSTDK